MCVKYVWLSFSTDASYPASPEWLMATLTGAAGAAVAAYAVPPRASAAAAPATASGTAEIAILRIMNCLS